MEFFKRNWLKITSTIITVIVSITVLYLTVESHSIKIEKLEVWKTDHSLQTATFMGEVLTELKSINAILTKLD